MSGETPRSCSWRRAAAPGWTGELFGEPGRRDFVRLEQRLAVPLIVGVLLGRFGLRHGQAGTRRQLAHRFGKGHLVGQLDELDHVTAHAAAVTLEEALVVDVKGRRFLTVEGTQSLPCRAAAPQRDALLDDLDDVGVRLQVVDERGGKETQRPTPSIPRS